MSFIWKEISTGFNWKMLGVCCFPAATNQFETTLPTVVGFQVHHISRDQRLTSRAGKCCACLGTDRPWDEFPEVPSFIKEIEEIESGNDLNNVNQIDRCLMVLEYARIILNLLEWNVSCSMTTGCKQYDHCEHWLFRGPGVQAVEVIHAHSGAQLEARSGSHEHLGLSENREHP